MKKPYWIALLGLFALSAALTVYRVPVASSQGTTIVAAYVEGELPVADPDSDLWEGTSAVDVPLSAQLVAPPTLGEGGVRSIRVRALHNGEQIALLVEWEDATQDARAVRVDEFRDAVAVQFPLQAGQPFFCMGQAGGDVNIWHWKADWQADLAARQDVEDAFPNMSVSRYAFTSAPAGEIATVDEYTDTSYLPALAAGNPEAAAVRTSPVEDLMAGGFGTLASQPPEAQNVSGYGTWSPGGWRVIFSRQLDTGDPFDVSLSPAEVYPIAFAVWDGSNGERDGEKSTSQWASLQLSAPPAPERAPEPKPQVEEKAIPTEPLIWVVGPMGLAVVGVILLAGAVAFLAWLAQREAPPEGEGEEDAE